MTEKQCKTCKITKDAKCYDLARKLVSKKTGKDMLYYYNDCVPCRKEKDKPRYLARLAKLKASKKYNTKHIQGKIGRPKKEYVNGNTEIYKKFGEDVGGIVNKYLMVGRLKMRSQYKKNIKMFEKSNHRNLNIPMCHTCTNTERLFGFVNVHTNVINLHCDNCYDIILDENVITFLFVTNYVKLSYTETLNVLKTYFTALGPLGCPELYTKEMRIHMLLFFINNPYNKSHMLFNQNYYKFGEK